MKVQPSCRPAFRTRSKGGLDAFIMHASEKEEASCVVCSRNLTDDEGRYRVSGGDTCIECYRKYIYLAGFAEHGGTEKRSSQATVTNAL